MVAATQAMICPFRITGMIIDWSVLWTLPNRASLWMNPSPGLMPTVGSSFQYFMMYRIGWCRIAENAMTPWQDRYVTSPAAVEVGVGRSPHFAPGAAAPA